MIQAADPITAIREADARGEIALIFADLRATLDVPFVNLIWRHIAAVPGGLPWTWALVRPLYVSPVLAQWATNLRAGLHLPEIPVLDDFVCDSAGVRESARAVIGPLIDDYNRANATNFLALLAARAVLASEAEPGGVGPELSGTASPTAKQRADGPRLLGLDEFDPSLLALVEDLDRFGRTEASGAIASLYRHLAHWPAFLALAHTALLPRHLDGALRAEQQRTLDRGHAMAADLARYLRMPDIELDGGIRDQVFTAVDQFTRLMIGRMVVMGEALAHLLPKEQAG
jgi:hypothetical protein